MIGIGGISMSGLAEILLKDGFAVSGSDRSVSILTKKLEDEGAQIFTGQSASNIIPGIDCVVYSAAIHPDNPEYAECVRQGLPMLSRAQLLGQIMRNYDYSIAVSGTHGKTTTTSMITNILLASGKDPTVSVGGMLRSIGGNIHIGTGHDLFMTEACEYTNSFLEFFPTMGIILNVEADHLDFFKDIDDIRNSFSRFVKLLPDDGVLVINDGIRDYRDIIGDFRGKVITFGDSSADVYAQNISYDENAMPSFDLYVSGRYIDRIELDVPGEHNVENALAAIAAAMCFDIDEKSVAEALKSFDGAERRFQKKGEIAGTVIYDDYAHHPQEIEATLKAAKHLNRDRIVCVFQSHTYTRTKALLDEFAEALCLADVVVLPDIYPARETDTLGISSGTLADLINQKGGCAYYVPTFDEVESFLLTLLVPGDMCITMGAGDVVKIGERLLGM